MNDDYDIVEVSKILRCVCLNAKSYVCINYELFDRDIFSHNDVYIRDMTFRSDRSFLYNKVIQVLELNSIPYIEKKTQLPYQRKAEYKIEINI